MGLLLIAQRELRESYLMMATASRKRESGLLKTILTEDALLLLAVIAELKRRLQPSLNPKR